MSIAMRFVAVAAGALLANVALADDLVTNGSFENFDSNTYFPNSWDITPAANGSLFGISSYAHTGDYSITFAAVSGEDDSISQMLATTAGQQYELSFYHSNFDSGGDHLGVWWEGQLILDMPPLAGVDDDNSGWLHVVLQITATTNGSELRFSGFDGPSFSYIDDVSVTPTPGAAAVLGLGGLAMSRRRR